MWSKIKSYLIKAAFIGGLILFVIYTKNTVQMNTVQKRYFSGMLVSGQVSRCGLVKIIRMDTFSCKLPEDFCYKHSSLLNERMRISAVQIPCSEDREMRCGRDGDFYEANFEGSECFLNPQIVKVMRE